MNRQELDQQNCAALAESLKALAAETETQCAPAHLETSLLAAFRRQHDAVALPNQTPIVRMPIKEKLREKRWRLFPVWTYATAAAVLILAGYGVSIWRSANSAPEEISSNKNAVRLVNPIEEHLTPLNDETSLSLKPTAKRKHGKPVDDGSSVQSSLGEFTLLAGEEIATDFLPLAYETDSQPMESGQVIRVQVPRTTLASFGLPVNLERANDTIKADLLLAEDGSARAIRFIR
ncbi:MAG: hypothetical protein ACKVZH_14265 [Blastocatellia bacterium]